VDTCNDFSVSRLRRVGKYTHTFNEVKPGYE